LKNLSFFTRLIFYCTPAIFLAILIFSVPSHAQYPQEEYGRAPVFFIDGQKRANVSDFLGDLRKWEEALAIPRPNHSEALAATAVKIKSYLATGGVPFVTQEFTLQYHKMLAVSLAAFVLAMLLGIAVSRKKPFLALAVLMAIPALLIAEFELFVPFVSWVAQKQAENIIVSFHVATPVRELIFAAHYDSKTDIFDHIQRARVYWFMIPSFGVGLLIVLWVFLARKLSALNGRPARIAAGLAVAVFITYWGLVVYTMGGYVIIPKERQSIGAVDNGGAVVTLLALAKDIQEGNVRVDRSNITLLFTAGEEINLLGADAYVKARLREKGKRPPASLINLELAGQNGGIVYLEKSGVFLKYYEADPGLVRRVDSAVRAETGVPIKAERPGADDSQRFLAAGIPSVTIGNSGLPGYGMTGFHCEKDSLKRVNYHNIELMVAVLGRYIESY
jgi:hypothetical protein